MKRICALAVLFVVCGLVSRVQAQTHGGGVRPPEAAKCDWQCYTATGPDGSKNTWACYEDNTQLGYASCAVTGTTNCQMGAFCFPFIPFRTPDGPIAGVLHPCKSVNVARDMRTTVELRREGTYEDLRPIIQLHQTVAIVSRIPNHTRLTTTAGE